MTQFEPGLISAIGENFNRPIGAALQQGIVDWKQQKKEDAAAKALYNAVAPAPGADGSAAAHPIMPPEQFNALSARDRIGAVSGYVQSAALKNAMASGALETSRAKYFDARAAQDSNANAADNKFTANYLQATSPQLQAGGVPLVQGGGGFPGGSPLMTAVDGPAPAVNPNLNRNDILRMALQSGMRPEAALARATGLGGDGAADTPVVSQDLGHGRTAYRMPGSRQFEVKDNADENLLDTKPQAADIPAGHIALQSGKGWKVVPDPTQFKTTRDPFTGATTTEYIGKSKVNPDGSPAAKPNEVKRYTAMGRAAIYDANTKQFLRYDN
jgi:hypothetical protein